MKLEELAGQLQTVGFLSRAAFSTRTGRYILEKGGKSVEILSTKDAYHIWSAGKYLKVTGVSEEDFPIIVCRLLSYGNGSSEVGKEIESFRYPSQYLGCCLYPEMVTSSGVIYKDFEGKRYLHSDQEGKVSLLLYKAVYDRNREWSLLSLPEMKPIVSNLLVPVSSSVSDRTALNLLQTFYEVPDLSSYSRRSLPARMSATKGVSQAAMMKNKLMQALFTGVNSNCEGLIMCSVETVISESEAQMRVETGSVTKQELFSSMAVKLGLPKESLHRDKIEVYSF